MYILYIYIYIYIYEIGDRYISVILIGMVQITVVVWLSGPFFQSKNQRTLPYKVWLPYDNSPDRIFWITYVPVSIAITTVAFIASANDIVFCGLIMVVCGQLKLLTYRLTSLPKRVEKALVDKKLKHKEIGAFEQEMVKQNILHHIFVYELVWIIEDKVLTLVEQGRSDGGCLANFMLIFNRCRIFFDENPIIFLPGYMVKLLVIAKLPLYIYRFANTIKSAFTLVILTQFITSSLIISINVYQLSTSKSIDMEFFTKLCFLICVLMEFFLFCWFGNELIVQSEEFGNFIHKIDWISLRLQSTKRLLFVALRATKPIVMSR
ncbi:odorant receptor Or1-like [Nasonia vitripennis]|uniref:Odorant receptor n=1 Tax=Nasonia vitripennis TaxID=7425 RepID=A0A7M7T9V3_NASVI|nr:odorant receptor Or1-like [Nasonia vitripennis]